MSLSVYYYISSRFYESKIFEIYEKYLKIIINTKILCYGYKNAKYNNFQQVPTIATLLFVLGRKCSRVSLLV